MLADITLESLRRVGHGLLTDGDEPAARSVKVLNEQNDAGDKQARDISGPAPVTPVDCACITRKPKRGDRNGIKPHKNDVRHAVADDR